MTETLIYNPKKAPATEDGSIRLFSGAQPTAGQRYQIHQRYAPRFHKTSAHPRNWLVQILRAENAQVARMKSMNDKRGWRKTLSLTESAKNITSKVKDFAESLKGM